jgi:hypothetical protein
LANHLASITHPLPVPIQMMIEHLPEILQEPVSAMVRAAILVGANEERQRITEIMNSPEARLDPSLGWAVAATGLTPLEAAAALQAAAIHPPDVGVEPQALTMH